VVAGLAEAAEASGVLGEVPRAGAELAEAGNKLPIEAPSGSESHEGRAAPDRTDNQIEEGRGK
jgi:hypothetical protein